ncbi:Arylsulfatase G [Holothuria leucospilota]|uniref:Arylsulfatase G n=1 Tax=Holothuria leucospilota TaxID=206669 RepID=A0A9Q1H9H1_HOLLE|nr:Arylsulfatase G [Holothuria leucospilota]
MQASYITASAQPNFVILLMDDVGYGDITSFWNPSNVSASTPFVDYMAANGISAPSRASLLTARLGARTGITSTVFPSTRGGLPSNETTFGETFSKAGYKTGMIGKWHMGVRGDFHPYSRGFDFYTGLPYSPDMGCTDEEGYSEIGSVICPNDWFDIPGYSDFDCYLCPSGEGDNFPALPLINGRQIVKQPLNMTYLSLRYIQSADAFITERETTTPFLLYVGLQHTHTPFFIMPEFAGKSARGDAYGDALLEMDWVIETIVKVIEDNGEAESTLIWVARGGGSSSKYTIWEGGHRIPALAYWPGTIEGGRVSDELVSMMDIYPTMASLAGIDMPGNRIYDGIDISNILLDRPFSSKNRVLYHPLHEYENGLYNGKMGAVRMDEYKAMYMTGGIPECGGLYGPSTRHDPPLLFNVKEDPMESTPIDPASSEYQSVLMEVNQALVDLEQSLLQDNTSVVDYTFNYCVMPCCNPLNVVCRCN